MLHITAAQWQRLSPLIDHALELSPAQRALWLSTDPTVQVLPPEQHEQLLMLLQHQRGPETRDFLPTLPALNRRLHDSETFQTGDHIGPYELLSILGQGGMSQVWHAKRIDGAYQRDVALKLPFAHANAAWREHFSKRLEREVALLAKLEHPNIARFYDAGITNTALGTQPYLALELVQGIPITQYAANKRLNTRQRCLLFIQVLEAVQYAHQHLVVHRDLKPSNIMVRDTGQIALLDFGVAKMLDEETLSGDATQLTREIGQAITPAYASPEQLLGHSISTASDIYSAGVLLYELLCGKRPFISAENNLAALVNAQQSVPTFAATLQSSVEGEAAQFGLASRKALIEALRGDLTAITTHSLRHESEKRYTSAAAFADDMQRYLDDKPVLARQGAALYLLQKFVRRQRIPLFVGLLGVTVAGTLGTTALLQQQRARESTARFESTNALLARLLDGISPEMADKQQFTAKELLDRTVSALSPDASAEYVKILDRIAELYRSIGDYENAVKLQKKSIEISAQTGQTVAQLSGLAHLVGIQEQSGATDDALLTLGQADQLTRRTRRLPIFERIELEYHRALLMTQMDKLEEASQVLAHLEESLRSLAPEPAALLWEARVLQSRAALYLRQSRPSDTVKASQRAAQLFSALGEKQKVEALQSEIYVARALMELGEFSRALEVGAPAASAIEARYGQKDLLSLFGRSLQSQAALYLGRSQEAQLLAGRIVSATGNDQELADYAASAQRTEIEALLQKLDFPKASTAVAQWMSRTKECFEKRFPLCEAVGQMYLLELALRKGARREMLTSYVALFEVSKSIPQTELRLRARIATLQAVSMLRGRNFSAAKNHLAEALASLDTARGERYQSEHLILTSYQCLVASGVSETAICGRTFEQLQQTLSWQASASNLRLYVGMRESNALWSRLPLVIL